jgi:hypothetical protein
MSEAPKFCLSRKDRIPPNGFRCICPVVGGELCGADFIDLVDKANAAIVASGHVPPPDLARQVEHSLCDDLPGYKFCKPCSSMKQTVSFSAIVRWVRAMYEFATKRGFQLVSQGEAERRAKICAACPYQVETSGCWGCKGIAGLLPAIAGARTTAYDPQLKACGVCGCYNAVSVHLPVSHEDEADLVFPDHCWKKPTQIG